MRCEVVITWSMLTDSAHLIELRGECNLETAPMSGKAKNAAWAHLGIWPEMSRSNRTATDWSKRNEQRSEFYHRARAQAGSPKDPAPAPLPQLPLRTATPR